MKKSSISDRMAPESEDGLTRIYDNYSHLSNLEQKIADYMIKHYDEAAKWSITTVALKIGTNPAAITRFCQTLHYKGFSEFKYHMENSFISMPESNEQITKEDSADQLRQKLLQFDMEALYDSLLHLNMSHLKAAAKAICVAKEFHIYTDGGPSSSALTAYQIFMQIGIRCQYFTDTQLSLLAAAQLGPGDVILHICRLGQPTMSMQALLLAKQKGATIIGVTAHQDSALGKNADILLCYSSRIKSDLRYLHIARMCEIAVIGLLQSAVINNMSDNDRNRLTNAREALNVCKDYNDQGAKAKVSVK